MLIRILMVMIIILIMMIRIYMVLIRELILRIRKSMMMIRKLMVMMKRLMLMIISTEKDSSQPAMRVKRRGEKSLAGLTAEPAFKPKLRVARFSVGNCFFCPLAHHQFCPQKVTK